MNIAWLHSRLLTLRQLTDCRSSAVAAIAILSIPACHSPGEDPPAAAIGPVPALTVTSAMPRTIIWPVTLDASGAIVAWQEASIGAQIGGYQLVDVRVNVGDRVRRGEVLARLDPALLRAEEAQLLAGYEQAELNRSRAMELQGSGAISDLDVLQSQTQFRTAAALLEGIRLQLRYTNVIAPDDGTISARSATLGAVVPTGQEMFRLIRQDRLEWRAEVTAAQLDLVKLGQEVTIRLTDDSVASATVRQISPALDTATRLAIVYADIDAGTAARAGMYVTGSIELDQSSALVVPAESVVTRDGHSHVLTLVQSGTAISVSLRRVVVGRRVDDAIEVIDGLSEYEEVVVQGAGFLVDGDVVRIASVAAGGRPDKE